LGLACCGEQLGVEELILEPPLNDSAKPFSHGDLASIWAVLVVLLVLHQSLKA